MNKRILIIGSIFGVIAIILGAFAAHGLKPRVSISAMASFQTGVRYQMYHAIVLLFLGSTIAVSKPYKRIIFGFLFFGVLLFSGSIYLLSLKEIINTNLPFIAIVTPIGGALLILGWLVMLTSFIKSKH